MIKRKSTKPTTACLDLLPEYPPEWIHQLLARRGIRYGDCQLDLRHMLSPQRLRGISEAVAILRVSLEKNHTFALVGDYDVDGASGAVLGVEALKSFGAHTVHALLPDRFVGGYGLQPNMVEKAADLGVSTLITVDNGIAAIEAITLAKQLGMKVIVTDHHLPGDALPDADAIVNPSIEPSDDRAKNLAGVGVIFYVMCALRTHLREKQWFLYNKLREPNMGKLLDLVALGTVADMANIDHNNRILIKAGVTRIRAGNARKGVITLLEAMQVNFRECTTRDIGFSLAPPLNAAGRLQHMDLALDCLLAKSWPEARAASAELVAQNMQRRQLQSVMCTQALEQAKQFEDDKVLVLYNDQWNQGLTGLVAGMIKDTLGKSTFVVTNSGDALVGSARGAVGDHVVQWLQQVHLADQEILARFGGHAKAAGFTLFPDTLERFRELLNATYDPNQQQVDEDDVFDGEMPIEDINLDNALLLEKLTPWGRNCIEPLFFTKLHLTGYQIMGGNHLRMQFTIPCVHQESESGSLLPTEQEKNIDGVAFYQTPKVMPTTLPAQVGIVFHLEVNRFRGRKQVQLIVKEICPSNEIPYQVSPEKDIDYGIDEVDPAFVDHMDSSGNSLNALNTQPSTGNSRHTSNDSEQENYNLSDYAKDDEEQDDNIGNQL